MDLSLDDTIAAIASPPGGARRGIVRISGPLIRHILSGWFQPDDTGAWGRARFAARYPGRIVSVNQRAPIAVDLYDWPSRSYTGQPLAELHLPGSPPLLDAVLSEALQRGARMARPGEFTLRAFLAGKLDLLQAEAVLGVIDAHDHQELQTALAQLAGSLSGRLSELRRNLLELLADLEAGLDFIEEDIEFVTRCEVLGRVAMARSAVGDLLKQSTTRMQTSARPRVVLVGLPNAGKSTLFNRLTASQAALVSSVAGTTRDFLEATVESCGMRFDLVDTAGWDEQPDSISITAQQFKSTQIKDADLVVWCSAATLSSEHQDQDHRLFSEARRGSRSCVRILTQTDHVDARPWLHGDRTSPLEFEMASDLVLEVSAVAGLGLEILLDHIRDCLAKSTAVGRQWLGMTAARCRESLEATECALERAEESAGIESTGDELIAVDIREALDHLGQILGTIYTDDILDRVFSKFCIGK